MQILQLQQV